ncbi:MAG TPA: hypothetical protein VFT45_12045, partial [Longimicrobium sp.]|nr:hypothetical protein [Longimicrobium sp.]
MRRSHRNAARGRRNRLPAEFAPSRDSAGRRLRRSGPPGGPGDGTHDAGMPHRLPRPWTRISRFYVACGCDGAR